MEWQPIITYDKRSFRAVLLSDGHNVVHGYWSTVSRQFVGCDAEDFTYSQPKFWMPLPAPPPLLGDEGRKLQQDEDLARGHTKGSQ